MFELVLLSLLILGTLVMVGLVLATPYVASRAAGETVEDAGPAEALVSP